MLMSSAVCLAAHRLVLRARGARVESQPRAMTSLPLCYMTAQQETTQDGPAEADTTNTNQGMEGKGILIKILKSSRREQGRCSAKINWRY